MKKEKMKRREKERKKEENKTQIKFGALFLLFIMLFSVIAYAIVSSLNSGSSTSPEDISEIPFQQFQDPNTGIIFWGAIRNSEQFIFENITGFDEREDLRNLAQRIKETDNLELYYGENVSSGVPFLLERALVGIHKDYTITDTVKCTSQNFLLQTSLTLDGECMSLELPLTTQEQNKEIEILSYFLIQ